MIGVIARLHLRRVLRGRSVWIAFALAALPVIFALLLRAHDGDEPQRFEKAAEVGLRFLATLATTLLLCNAIGEEIEQKTITYLWSRPIQRSALLFGKILAIAPLVMALVTVSYAVTWVVAGAPSVELLLRELAGAAVAVLAASAFSVGIGTLFPKHPFIFALGYFAAEQVLFIIPNVAKLSIVYHARFVAGQPALGSETESVADALLGLALLTAIWLAVAVWRVGRSEYAQVDI